MSVNILKGIKMDPIKAKYTGEYMFYGTKFWYHNGRLHRTDGPAIECQDGTNRYWINGQQLTENEWHNWRLAQWVNKKYEI